MDLLNIPLPSSFPECEDVSQYQYFSEKKGGLKLCICWVFSYVLKCQKLDIATIEILSAIYLFS